MYAFTFNVQHNFTYLCIVLVAAWVSEREIEIERVRVSERERKKFFRARVRAGTGTLYTHRRERVKYRGSLGRVFRSL